MNISIKKINGEIIFSGEFNSIKKCVEAAVHEGKNLSYSNLSYSDLSGSNLSYSNLRGSDLRGSNLRGSNLSYSNLSGSNLSYSNLSYSDLSGSNLRGSNLSYSNLSYSDLSGSNLSYSNLRGSDLRGSNLSGSNLSYSNLSYSDLSGSNLRGSNLSYSDLSGSNLSGSYLSVIKNDFLAEVLRLPNELEFLQKAISGGRINGSSYSGECRCLAGTLALAKGIENYKGEDITNGLTFHVDSGSPRERFFLSIKTGDTPETNPASAIVLKWTNEAIIIRDNIRKLQRCN